MTGNHYDAIAFWWEARELFLHLFADGTLIPLVRRATINFNCLISSILNRLVRFLWICDREIVNQNLFLIDMLVTFSNELERAKRSAMGKSLIAAKQIDAVFDQLLSNDDIDDDGITAEHESVLHQNNLSSAVGKTDREFYNFINDGLVRDKIHDFGWKKYVNYQTVLNKLNDLNTLPLSNSSQVVSEFDLDHILQLDSATCISKYSLLPEYLKKYVLLKMDLLRVDPSSPVAVDTSSQPDQSSHSDGIGNLPLDPFFDFEWMDESYASYVSGCVDSSSKEDDDDSKGGGHHHHSNPLLSLYMPEFDEISDPHRPRSELNINALSALDSRAETVLIQRLWQCWLSVNNSLDNYQSRKYNMNVLRHNIRNSLRKLSLFNYRLR